MLHKVVTEYGLRPLVFHVDGGWNSEEATHNINSLIDNRPSSFLIALPIAGALNNLTYPQAASSVASMNLNRKLIQQNPDIDVFLNPKYDISFNNGFWTQKALIIGNVIGANGGIRTPNPRITSALLYHLSYAGLQNHIPTIQGAKFNQKDKVITRP